MLVDNAAVHHLYVKSFPFFTIPEDWLVLLLLHQNQAWLGSLSGPPTSGAASSPTSTLTWRWNAGVTTSSPTTTASWAQRRWTWCWHTSPSTDSLAMKRCRATRPSASARPSWTRECLSRWALKYLGRRRRGRRLRTAAAACTGSWPRRRAPRHCWPTSSPTPPAPSRAATTPPASTGTRTATARHVRGTDLCHNIFRSHFWVALFSLTPVLIPNPVLLWTGWELVRRDVRLLKLHHTVTCWCL